MEPLSKRPGKRRRKSATAAALEAVEGSHEPEDRGRLKIGRRKLAAIRAILSTATPDSYNAMQLHLVWAGDYNQSALSDEAPCGGSQGVHQIMWGGPTFQSGNGAHHGFGRRELASVDGSLPVFLLLGQFRNSDECRRQRQRLRKTFCGQGLHVRHLTSGLAPLPA